MSFTTDAVADFADLITDHGVTITIRARSSSSISGDDEITWTTADTSVSAIWKENVTNQEVFREVGLDIEADAMAYIKASETIDENDRIVYNSKTYAILKIISKPDPTNEVMKVLVLNNIRLEA